MRSGRMQREGQRSFNSGRRSSYKGKLHPFVPCTGWAVSVVAIVEPDFEVRLFQRQNGGAVRVA